MDRNTATRILREPASAWDLIVVGGGATGLGVAVDAASRGYRVCLLEQADFAKGTSSRSTKIVHGGVRYLRQGHVSLVRKALRERSNLLRNAPHLVRQLDFVIPAYRPWEKFFYASGLKVYDLLAGDDVFPESQTLSRDGVLESLPALNSENLRGGVRYWDGQFDDARLAINLASTAIEQGATLANYVTVTGLCKLSSGAICGVRCTDRESNESWEVMGRVVVNATGPFTDGILEMDQPQNKLLAPSQGVHLVFDRSDVPISAALMLPKTDDGRVLFAIPWRSVVIVGTTDTPIGEPTLEPVAQEQEIQFVLEMLNRYIKNDLSTSDVRSVFAGIRPLVGRNGSGTSGLSRDHTLWADPVSKLVTITGGKWTTYREMADETVDLAAQVAKLPERPCRTATLAIHGKSPHEHHDPDLAWYGSDVEQIEQLRKEEHNDEQIHSDLAIRRGDVIFACREEMARTVDDVLARRTRSLLFNAKAASESAQAVAQVMAAELVKSDEWVAEQVTEFQRLAENYQVART